MGLCLKPRLSFITAASGQRVAGLIAAMMRPKLYSDFFRINHSLTNRLEGKYGCKSNLGWTYDFYR